MKNKTSVKMPKNSHIIGVKFNTKSQKYKNKEYYYKTNKETNNGEKIHVPTANSPKVSVVISNNNYKGKLNKNRKYKTY